MLVKLAFVIQRLKKYPKKFSSRSTKIGGGGQFFYFIGAHNCYEGGIELMGGPLVPPLGKTLTSQIVFLCAVEPCDLFELIHLDGGGTYSIICYK